MPAGDTGTRPAGRPRAWAPAIAAPLLGAAALEWLALTWPARPWVGLVLALAGLVALGLGRATAKVDGLRRASPEGLVLLAAALLAPPPWRWVLLAAGAGTLLGAALGSSRSRPLALLRETALAARSAALAIVVVAAGAGFVAALALSVPEVRALASPVAGLLGFLGMRAASFDGRLALTTLHGATTVPLTPSTLGLFPAAALWLAFTALRLLAGVRLSLGELLRSALVVLVSAAVALVLALLGAFQYEIFVDFEGKEVPVGFLADPGFRMLVLALLAAPFLALGTRRPESREAAAGRARHFGRWTVLLAVLACVTGFLLFVEEPGERKPGRVMIDEAHSQWESVEPRYDTDWYGYDSGYNYSVAADYLGRFYRVTLNRGELSPEALRDVDVLLVKIPTRSYTPEECRAVMEFVRGGGGLLLVGEHTNVWGSGYYLNALARPAGFEFRHDVVFDLRRKFEQVYDPPALARHPILSAVRRFLFAVSCSIAPHSLAVRPVMWSGGLWSLGIDYAVSNFYPAANLDLGATVGPHAQCVAVHVGRGRIAGFTDSTVWSTFSAMLPGKPELLLGLVEWLDRRNRFADPYPAARVLLLALAGWVAWAAWRRATHAGLATALAVAGVLLGARAAEVANARAYPPPRPVADLERVAFVADDSTYALPSWGFVDDWDRSYAIFFQWVQRLGMFPTVVEPGESLPRGTRTLVRVVGSRGLGPAGTAGLERALAQHVPVLLLVQADADSGLARFLAGYGIDFRPTVPYSSRFLDAPGGGARWQVPWETRHQASGGAVLLAGEGGRAVLCAARSAPLYVFLGGERFRDSWMGEDQGSTPSGDLRRQFELEFALFRGLVRGALETELREGAQRPLRVRTTTAGERTAPVDRPGGRPHSG